MRELGQRWVKFPDTSKVAEECDDIGWILIEEFLYYSMLLQTRNSLFGTLTWDTSRFTYLKIRCKPSADEGMRYFVNIQTDGPGPFLPSPLHTICILTLLLSVQSVPTFSSTDSGWDLPHQAGKPFSSHSQISH